ncbi:hypothetical protein FRB96_009635 [Tulasnella sp. 330]|nr:hypothetical protein FRB96_009635 [Tulasnella sp. 330]KAG8877068.1 hypothetical protein FRB97_003747 [Tulasnella sp. 331]KAG8881583.1 hypothetical protein FRB98_004245 [Tulasnella sp. 332]
MLYSPLLLALAAIPAIALPTTVNFGLWRHHEAEGKPLLNKRFTELDREMGTRHFTGLVRQDLRDDQQLNEFSLARTSRLRRRNESKLLYRYRLFFDDAITEAALCVKNGSIHGEDKEWLIWAAEQFAEHGAEWLRASDITVNLPGDWESDFREVAHYFLDFDQRELYHLNVFAEEMYKIMGLVVPSR